MKVAVMKVVGATGLLLIAAGAPALQAAPAATGKKIVCWTDEKGVRSCGDRVPPQYAKGERQVFDSSGRVIGTQARELTDAEVAERDRLAAEAAAEEKRRSDQAAYDRYLLQAYGRVTDLQRTRKDRLDTLDGRIALSERSAVDAGVTLTELRKRAAGAPKNTALQKQLADYEHSALDNNKALASLKTERRQVCQGFAKDIRRFEELKNLPVSEPMDCGQPPAP